jgi:tellurite resistance protein TerC
MINEIWLWIGFHILIFFLLFIDLKVFNKKEHEVKLGEALLLSAFWIGLAVAFNVFVYFFLSPEKGMAFLTGYIIEKALSVDNLFVFLLIFTYFNVPKIHQHTILFWGIVSAMAMRAVFILLGVSLIHKFEWVLIILGLFLIYAGIKLPFQKEKEVHPEKNFILRIFRKFFPVTKDYHENKFFVKIDAKTWATPLLIVLIMIETTDVIFAVDSIPAILGITTDPFIAYSSNIFAILGLRALYFALAKIMQFFYYLNHGLAFILSFIGVKMILAELGIIAKFFNINGVSNINIPIQYALLTVLGILVLAIVASILRPHIMKIVPMKKIDEENK